MTGRTLVVITAGLREPSSTRLLGDRLAAATAEALPGLRVETVELRRHAHDLANALLTGFPAGELARAIDLVREADGLIVVSPVFNASYSGLFKTFFDVLDPDLLVGKPVLIAATGGTPRHALALDYALRPLFAYLRAAVVPTGVFAAAEDWADSGLVERVERAAGELATLIETAAATGPRDPFDELTPFEQLLG